MKRRLPSTQRQGSHGRSTRRAATADKSTGTASRSRRTSESEINFSFVFRAPVAVVIVFIINHHRHGMQTGYNSQQQHQQQQRRRRRPALPPPLLLRAHRRSDLAGPGPITTTRSSLLLPCFAHCHPLLPLVPPLYASPPFFFLAFAHNILICNIRSSNHVPTLSSHHPTHLCALAFDGRP